MSNSPKYKQSLAYWCLADTEWQWSSERIFETARHLGLQSVELAPPETYPRLSQYNLICALCSNGMPGAPFVRGLNNLSYHDEIITRTKEAVDLASEFGFPNVIAFTGYKWKNAEDPASGEISLPQSLENCVKGLASLAGYAQSKNVTICLEHLNTRDNSHPMKGHPGYHGDDIDFCAEIIRRVNSPNVKLLFDVYHVQLMHGDIIHRLRQHRDIIGHVHTAGCPGRNELDDRQEIHYPGIVTALKEIDYRGYVGHELIPTGDPTQAFKTAVDIFNA